MKRQSISVAKMAAMALAMAPTGSHASQTSSAAAITGIDIQTQAGGQVIFYLTGARTGMPACATTGNRWAFNGASPAGQATLSMIMTAYAAGKHITVYGTGVCDVWGDTETVNYISA